METRFAGGDGGGVHLLLRPGRHLPAAAVVLLPDLPAADVVLLQLPAGGGGGVLPAAADSAGHRDAVVLDVSLVFLK